MKKETLEEFLARGGKIQKITHKPRLRPFTVQELIGFAIGHKSGPRQAPIKPKEVTK